MRRRLRSSLFQSYFKRDGNAEDKEGSMDQEQSRPAPLLELPTSIQHISATTSTSAFSLPASLPLPAAPATGSTDVEVGSLLLPLQYLRMTLIPVKKLYHNLPLLLNDIRLLQLSPSENEDAAIHCELFCTALDSKSTHPYKALSYVWGSEDKPYSIFIDAIYINQKDDKEKGHQVQSMAKIYAKASRVIVWLGEKAAGSDQALEEIRIAAERDQALREIHIAAKNNKREILTLLQQSWFERIWVLQEVAAARHILIKCGSAEVDGFVFCLGLKALNLSNELSADLRVRILSVTYLIRGAIFRPKCATRQSDNFSLNIRPLGELIEMYHTRKATDHRNKVYALLGMSSDNPTAAGLSANYTILWEQLFKQLTHFILSKSVSVRLLDNKDIALIEGKGCIFGEVNAPSYRCVKEAWSFCWTLPTTAKSVQKGDIICLLQGASRPMILRPYNYHWAVIIIAVSLALYSQATTEDIKWSELLQSITIFPHNFPLIWNWDIDPDNNHDYFASIPEHSKTELEGCLDAATRIRNVRLILQEMKWYGVAVKNLREETAVLEKALRSMDNLEKTCPGSGGLEKEDAKEIMVNQLIEDKGQWTLLCLAVENGHETVVKLLLDTSKFNLQREELRTALWLAEQKGYKAIVKMLLDTGKVDAGIQDENGQTVLHMAAMNGHEAVVKLLFDTGKRWLDGQRYIWRQRMGMRRLLSCFSILASSVATATWSSLV
ncbi:heterokaryon incompatibility protein-domain-containing protein [Pseudoneurospora amorphoporcata]|uniref:Heterokaryon incompatibility protein-domain-containing protein n=1 Tax=Pseudoneurospora amorphoporcata TaxID=241081 RepID=A0AAN6SBT5_9PEZI|nr:heterokaryon incompatibility protein-domain-containing protein [Pseudoneurospora amorphoporcata]